MGIRNILTLFAVMVMTVTLLIAPSTARAQAPQYTIETIVMVGDLDADTAATFSGLDIPVLNAKGDVAFLGGLETGNSFNDTGIWIGDQNGLALVVREGDPAPGGGNFGTLRRPKINDAGQVAFLFFTIGESRIAVGSPGILTLIAREGDSAPGTGGEIFTDIFDPTLNANGEVSFHGLLDPLEFNVDTGIWAGGPSNLGLVAREGDIAPGAGGLVFKSFEATPEKYQHNDAGQVAFRGVLDTGDTQSDQGIWMGGPGEVTLVAREGDEAPGTVGQTFKQVGLPTLNSSGQVAFNGEIETGGAATEFGLWLGNAASPSLVLRTGDEAPGTGGLKFKSFSNPVVSSLSLNASGDIGFAGRIDMGGFDTDLGFWAGKGPSLALVFRTGDEAPGTGGEIFQTFGAPVLNALGEVAFVGGLKTLDLSNREGIWIWRAGTLELIARQTQPLEIAPGDVRVVSNLSFAGSLFNAGGNDNGQSTGFNDIGQIAFHASFQDGSAGIFLATPSVVANAGSDQTVTDSETVILDGSGSFDPDGTSLQYSWTLAGTEIGIGSTPTVGPFAAGEYAITLTVTDADGHSASNVMVLSVTLSPNQLPVAVAGPDQTVTDIETVDLDGTGSFDPEGTALSFVWRLGGVTIATGPTPTVGPFPVGPQIITLTVTDADGGIGSDSLLVTVVPAPPVATDDLVSLPKGKSTTIDVLANDIDPFGAGLSVLSTGPASNGTVALNADDTVTYSRNGNFKNGCDKFTYTIQDGRGLTDQGLVQVAVGSGTCGPGPGNSPPVADDQAVSTPQDTPVAITLTASDADGDALTFAIVTGPTDGALSGTAPNVTYTPNAGFTGTDSFTFKANDGIVDSNIATVTIGVAAAPSPTGTVKGAVKKDGKRISGAFVRLDPGTATERQVTTNKAGKFEFVSVPAGIHTITATDGVCSVGPFPILVTAGQTLTLDLFLVCP